MYEVIKINNKNVVEHFMVVSSDILNDKDLENSSIDYFEDMFVNIRKWSEIIICYWVILIGIY